MTSPHTSPPLLRSFSLALQLLEQCQKNRSRLAAQAAMTLEQRHASAMSSMEWTIGRLGYTVPLLESNLKIVHIAGTKGKGSTAAFTERLVRHCSRGKARTGLYTSPHLVDMRERIRIDGKILSKSRFTDYFFETWDCLSRDQFGAPPFFSFITAMAFHVFMKESVDVAVIEVGVGGLCDATNFIRRPVATAITSIGIDHVASLGSTAVEIALQKAGIMKPGVPCVVSPKCQPEGVMEVFKRRASEVGAAVLCAEPIHTNVALGIAGAHQVFNAGIALALSRLALGSDPSELISPLSDAEREGLKKTMWHGRCQIINDPNAGHIRYLLDGSHTFESVQYSVLWFNQNVSLEKKRILFVGLSGGRDPTAVFQPLIQFHQKLQFHQCYVVIPTTLLLQPTDVEILAAQNLLASLVASGLPVFSNIIPNCSVAVEVARQNASGPTDCCVIGSLHLVGGFLGALCDEELVW